MKDSIIYYLCPLKFSNCTESHDHNYQTPYSSKSRRTCKEVGSNKRRPRNLAAWKRVVGFKVRRMQAHASDSHYRNGLWIKLAQTNVALRYTESKKEVAGD